MSEARFNIRPRPAAPQRRAPLGTRPAHAPTRPPPLDEPCYPLDPPLVDVRIPVRPPHATATAYSRGALMHRFPRAEVGDDLHMLFSEPDGGPGNDPGNPKQSRLSPDVMVALKVPRDLTRTDYDADRLGPPDFVLEVLSKSTWRHDLNRKLDVYQGIGVRECLLFDVSREAKSGVGKELWGYALTPERREPLDEVALPNGKRGLGSAVLGLVAYVAERTPPSAPDGTWMLTMRWHDPATGKDLPDHDELHASEARALAGQAQARAGEARAQAEAQAQREEAQAQREEAQAHRKEAQAQRARADTAQRRIAELEERLRDRS